MSNNQKLSQQESFNQGVLAALHALKTALQASPGFNNDVLVGLVKTMLQHTSDQVDQEFFNLALLPLLHDHVIDENGNVTTREVSLD